MTARSVVCDARPAVVRVTRPVSGANSRRVAVLLARRLGVLIAICRVDLEMARLANPAARPNRRCPIWRAAKAELEAQS